MDDNRVPFFKNRYFYLSIVLFLVGLAIGLSKYEDNTAYFELMRQDYAMASKKIKEAEPWFELSEERREEIRLEVEQLKKEKLEK